MYTYTNMCASIWTHTHRRTYTGSETGDFDRGDRHYQEVTVLWIKALNTWNSFVLYEESKVFLKIQNINTRASPGPQEYRCSTRSQMQPGREGRARNRGVVLDRPPQRGHCGTRIIWSWRQSRPCGLRRTTSMSFTEFKLGALPVIIVITRNLLRAHP